MKFDDEVLEILEHVKEVTKNPVYGWFNHSTLKAYTYIYYGDIKPYRTTLTPYDLEIVTPKRLAEMIISDFQELITKET